MRDGLLSKIAQREGLWYHVDAAYGGCFLLLDEERPRFRGIERADSVVIDPHKGLFIPYGSGAVLVRETEHLRKSHGFHLVCQGPDPIASVAKSRMTHRVQVIKAGPHVAFSINDLAIFQWVDDGESCGPLLGGGKIGFRQMAPTIAEYGNLTVHEVAVGE